MTEKDIEKLIQMNQRLNLVLGYALAFIFPYSGDFVGMEKNQYDWLMKAVENLVYLDKPLPLMP